jgi:hypothetical protein
MYIILNFQSDQLMQFQHFSETDHFILWDHPPDLQRHEVCTSDVILTGIMTSSQDNTLTPRHNQHPRRRRSLAISTAANASSPTLVMVGVGVVLLTWCVGVEGGFERVCGLGSRPHPDGICGSAISDILQLLCGTRGFNKRALDEPTGQMFSCPICL